MSATVTAIYLIVMDCKFRDNVLRRALNTVVFVQMSCRKYNLSMINHKEAGPL